VNGTGNLHICEGMIVLRTSLKKVLPLIYLFSFSLVVMTPEMGELSYLPCM